MGKKVQTATTIYGGFPSIWTLFRDMDLKLVMSIYKVSSSYIVCMIREKAERPQGGGVVVNENATDETFSYEECKIEFHFSKNSSYL